ncbi:pectinesterase family protein [Brevundimonas sp.]|jgi:pectinesterase|uniref:pectinesterase family protein n=1 Tax=Brevundimonas sp. TaxID=1871086 RepID=UPI0037837DE3
MSAFTRRNNGLCLSLVLVVVLSALALLFPGAARAGDVRAPRLFPADGATGVNPDTQLIVTFDGPPTIATSGKIRIYDAEGDTLVDTIDVGIPASPNPTGRVIGADGSTRAPVPPAPAGPDNPAYQAYPIGGAWFHAFPIMTRGNAAIIYPHNGKLTYGRNYVVRIDPGVLASADGGMSTDLTWTFSTRLAPPPADADRVVVAADGSGDFNTVQGAIDFAPERRAEPLTIFIRNGDYQEIVYLNGKSNLTLRGESRDGVVVHYPNNSAFNRIRPAFSVTNADDIQLSTFTIRNDYIGQAEALLMRGRRNIVDRMILNGSGDAFTTHGTIYMVDSLLTGDGDTILAYAALFCLRCEIRSVGPFTWTRTPQGSHGNVFVDSTFIYLDKPLPWSITATNPAGTKTPGVFGRLPRNGAAGTAYSNFPHAEMVLINTRTAGVPPSGWGTVEPEPAFDWSNLRLWEFNTMDIEGRPVDLSQRHPAMRILTTPADAAIIADYSRPEFVLGGWRPTVRE